MISGLIETNTSSSAEEAIVDPSSIRVALDSLSVASVCCYLHTSHGRSEHSAHTQTDPREFLLPNTLRDPDAYDTNIQRHSIRASNKITRKNVKTSV